MKRIFLTLFVPFVFLFPLNPLMSQDLVVKINGDTIRAKVIEVATDAIKYKKSSMPDGPTFQEKKSGIAFIKFSNGETEVYNKVVSTPTTSAVVGSTTTSTSESAEKKNKIEMIYNNFYINNQPASRKEVDRLLAKSNNPAVVALSKATKLTGNSQKIMKITSYPTTISGSAMTIFTFAEGYQLVQRGRATPSSFINMGLSLVGTLVFPITTKLLKKKSDKMYGKIIDMYNVTN